MRDAVPGSVELRLIPVVQVDGEAVGGELEGDTVPHQTGPDHGYALDVVRAHRRSRPLHAVQRLTPPEVTRYSRGEFGENRPSERDLCRAANSSGLSILTLRQRLCRSGVSD